MSSDERLRRKHCGARLKELRIQQGLTQEELAIQLHTTASNVAKIETGVSNPSIDLLLKNISIRRNQIVHEGDYIASNLSRQNIEKVDVDEVISFIEQLGTAIYNLVK